MKKIMNLQILLLLYLLLFVFGCSDDASDGQAARNVEQPRVAQTSSVDQFKDYFPTNIGTKWGYNISIGDREPLFFRITIWPTGGGREIASLSRGRLGKAAYINKNQSNRLTFQVKGLAARQGPLEYPQGVEIEVVEDSLGIFEDAKRIFWAVTTQQRFMAILVVTYDSIHGPHGFSMPHPSGMGVPHGMPSIPHGIGGFGEDGFSMQLLYFSGEPGIEVGMGKQSIETLLFAGFDSTVPGYSGERLLHFFRTVQPAHDRGAADNLGRGFTEDMWFAKGKGLVRLEQKVDGKTSMIWNLTAFSK